uniref:ATPase cation transporting 13A2 n=1 Tax=Cyprinus carpio TaxID=7962 RepID=A0A8C2KSI2_CYPCA
MDVCGPGLDGATSPDTEPLIKDPRPEELSAVSHMDVQGYKWVCWKVWLCRIGALCSLGLLLVLFNWRPRLGILARCKSCPVSMADVLLLKDRYGQQFVVDVLTEEIEEGSLEFAVGEADENEWRDTVQLHSEKKTLLRYYVFEGMRYIWIARKGAFCKASILNEGWSCSDLHDRKQGLSKADQSTRKQIFGANIIDVPVKSYLQLLFEEVLNPFYIFQVFSIILWMSDRYYYYAACILIISLISIGVSLYEIRKQSTTLRSMARLIVNAEECVSSEELVPGDCIVIPAEGLLLPCDAALLAGECMVNESMLTGESIPVMKTPLSVSEATYSPESQRRHTLFCGTQLIQAKGGGSAGNGAIAVMFSSEIKTVELLTSNYTSRFFFLILLCIHFFCHQTTWQELVIRSLDIVTIIVPPALPAAITTATIYAQNRLKRHGVFCISPPRINICGKTSLFCFDKTGTLTEEGLDVWGVMEVSGAVFSELVPDPLFFPPGLMLSALASCHSLAMLGGQAIGDPLELKMIESTGWELTEPENEMGLDSEFGKHRVLAVMRPPAPELLSQGNSVSQPVAIIRRFPFSSSLQRMSVVTVGPGGASPVAFLKGAPEMVASFCRRENLPSHFSPILREYASQGFRVLGFAYKHLTKETDLSTVERSTQKSVQVKMIDHAVFLLLSGDNILTAVNVARACGMVPAHEKVIFVHASPPTASSMASLQFHQGDGAVATVNTQETIDIPAQGLYQNGAGYHLAINGMSFAALCDHFPEYLPKILMRGTVYARMTPEQKTQLVKALQNLNYRVGMCGDGANDCGALRAADVGVSLSEAEASVASPFTSKSNNISCVPLLIKEGRCSLVTSFSLFKYMALYSLIQFASVLILYTEKTNLGDLQFLFFDLFLVTVLAIVMGRGGPSDELHPQRPAASLLSLPVLSSLLLHTLLLILAQVSALLITVSQDWYVPLNSTVTGAANLPNMENTSIFALSGFQYIIMSIVITKGYPYKKPLCYNFLFVGALMVFFALMSWLFLFRHTIIHQLLQLYYINDMNYKLLLVAVAALNFFICYMFEILIDRGALNCLRNLRGKRKSKKQYKCLDVQLAETPSWPPLNQPLFPTQCSVISVS